MVEGLTVEDIWKGDVKGVKVNGARNIGQGHPVKVPAVHTLRRSTMQGLMVVGLIVEEILTQNLSKSLECKIEVKVTRSSYLPS